MEGTWAAVRLRFQRNWLKHPYDGIRGEMPDWMPKSDKDQFNQMRYRLFMAVNRGEFSLRKLIKYFRWECMNKPQDLTDGSISIVMADPSSPLASYSSDIGRLAALFEAVQAGPSRGLQQRLGPSLEKHVARGVKIIGGASRAHIAKHGSQQQKAARWALQQETVDRLHATHPAWSHHQIIKKAAAELGVSIKTIQRHTRNPNKKVRTVGPLS